MPTLARRAWLAGLLLLAARAAPAQAPYPPAETDAGRPPLDRRYGYEEFAFLGWSKTCSAAIRHLRYPPSARGADPIWSRLGALSLEPDAERAQPRWLLSTGSPGTHWDPSRSEAASQVLAREGYGEPGFLETVRLGPAPALKDLAAVRTPATLDVAYRVAWPPKPHALSRVYYSALGNCALTVFERPGAPTDAYRYELVRLPVEARRRRAQSHLNAAVLLYRSENDLYGALEEARVAATMDPRLGEARYRHATLLAAHGRFEEALRELTEAVKLDARHGASAKKALEFEDIRKQPRFAEAIKPGRGTLPLDPR
ncbi:MAG: hypothetical protein HY554_04375 [Elusimicrobia bacterium]|nr:hypothetical protein [Elusimicrobiota bacterium]